MSRFTEEVDLSEDTPEGLEKVDGLPPGWYRVTCMDLSVDARSNALVLKFEVMDGEHAGGTISERLWDPAKADDATKKDMSRKRRLIFAKRMGLIGDNDFGKQNVGIPWDDAIGKSVAIQVKERKYKDKDDNEKVARNIDFGGIFPLDDQRVPEELRGVATAPANGTSRDTNSNNNGSSKPANSDFDGI